MAAEEYDEERIRDLDKAISQEEKSVSSKSPNTFAVGNEAFRSALFDHISYSVLKGIISQFGYHLQFMRMTTLKSTAIREEIVERQKEVRDAISAHDGAKASKLWKEYLNFAQDSLVTAIREYQK
jgi:DNA-binding GntR family transcriptional regulator